VPLGWGGGSRGHQQHCMCEVCHSRHDDIGPVDVEAVFDLSVAEGSPIVANHVAECGCVASSGKEFVTEDDRFIYGLEHIVELELVIFRGGDVDVQVRVHTQLLDVEVVPVNTCILEIE
jgi:hypothetical protein